MFVLCVIDNKSFWHFGDRYLNFHAKNAEIQNGGLHGGKKMTIAAVEEAKKHCAESLKRTLLFVYLHIGLERTDPQLNDVMTDECSGYVMKQKNSYNIILYIYIINNIYLLLLNYPNADSLLIKA